ncbi:EamA family transporter [Dictyobacter aurantiacus]|uniref:Threonine transporter RhtB n=1 Tax=Dictyobacter aurantiacus TaxID=1936993 RepID=A0A401ZNN2_9CHLR|nr:DMT family transporter [Dictyobacter aurantiacus]GCE08479.1 threonine transporter RhtB [Dictyobacter aurantiacus]
MQQEPVYNLPSINDEVTHLQPQQAGTFMRKVPPQVFALLAMVSVQSGAAVGKSLFQSIGPLGTTFLRLGFAAMLLLLFWRPDVRHLTRRQIGVVIIFGAATALMNGAFYVAINRIPLGIAVTLEFVGPLGVALLQSRRLKDLLWAALAAAGIVLLAPLGAASNVDLLGVVFALIAGIFWGVYIIFNVQLGRAFTGGRGLALSMLVSAILIAPIGIVSGGPMVFEPHILLIGLAVSALSTIIPFTLELEALRRLPSRVFGIFMSVEPAMAATIGFLFLHEVITVRDLLAMLLIITASIATSLEARSAHQ